MSTTLLIEIVLAVFVATALFFVVRIELRLKRLFKGSTGADLEALMHEVVARMKVLTDIGTHHEDDIVALEARLKTQGHAVKLMRFNPFPDVGGSQSFAVAIINETGDGVVFSSLYSRERMSVFAKQVTGGTSDVELTEEERSVIADAQKEAGVH